ncbi:MAG: C45 family autoproteolytic acyltransferase/hydrolase [Acidobacteria bacterium]|nr:C45 family autoproteolytic acyltransferase/hydrolase [Acidobacteriota bacterium]
MKRKLCLILVIAGLCIIGLSSCEKGSGNFHLTIENDSKQQGSNRFERNGWIYVHIEGSPEKLGYQHGYLLAEEINDLLRVMKPFLQHQSKRDWNFYRNASEQMLWPKMDKEYQDEIDGIVAGANAKGVKLDRYDIVAMNGFIELAYYYVPMLDKAKGQQASTKAPGNCSAFIATGGWTKDRRIVMGHNAWTDYVIGSRWNIIFDIKPKEGHRILMDGLPGVIASMDDFGVNSNGIMVTETTITSFFGFDPSGKPEFERARKALQYSNSIDDYVRIMLEGNNGGYANDWLVGDNKTGEIALFELGLKQSSVRRTKDGYFFGSNFPVDEKLLKTETTFDVNNKASSPNARRTRWEQLMTQYKGEIDIEAAKKFETDSFDAFVKKEGANERSLCGAVEISPRGVPEWDWPKYFPGGTVQAKVMDGQMAEKMQMQAAYGHPCAPDFIAEDFLKQHKEYEWMRGLLRDMKTGAWTQFVTGMK